MKQSYYFFMILFISCFTTKLYSQSVVGVPQVNSCVNDTVTFTITHPALNGVANAALRLTYNLDSLSYVGSSNLNPAFSGMVVNGGNGVVTLDWNTSNNQNIQAGNMVNLRFRVYGSSALTWDTLVNSSEFSDVNFNVVPQTFQNGGITNRTLRYTWQRQICQGQTLQMGGQTFSTGGNYQVVLPGSGSDCDTLVNLNLSVLPVICNLITGDLRYDNSNLTPLSGVPVELKTLLGNVVAADTTDSSGTFSMSGYANGTYIIDARIGYSSGGINSTDALLVNMHFSSVINLTSLRAKAGDVNGNLITNSVDALLISRRITNLVTSFSVGNFVNDKPTIYARGIPLSVSMRALSTGDVNGSFIVQPSAPTLVLDTVYGNGNVGTAVVRFTNPGSGVFERGIVWSSSPNPTISSNKSVAGNGGFGFTQSFVGVTIDSQFYARAYARTSAGVYYSPERSFTSVLWNRCPGSPSVTDIDGNLYHTVQIGNQCWMQSNLKVSKYRNGDVIPTGLSNSAWQNTTAGAYSIYNNAFVNDTLYGKLYNYYAVLDTRGLCPTGWHVPTDGEWNNMQATLGSFSVRGGVLKSKSTQPTLGGWTSPNTAATNSSGFTALPGGRRNGLGVFEFIENEGHYGYYFSLSGGGCRLLRSNSGYMGFVGLDNTVGFSVRCLRD
jgi:uncharacterized protein (TIGR02145 family)